MGVTMFVIDGPSGHEFSFSQQSYFWMKMPKKPKCDIVAKAMTKKMTPAREYMPLSTYRFIL